MNILQISYKAIKANKLTSLLSILLVTFGIAIITAIMLLSVQLSNNLEKNARGIDLVVGAKGSPLQLILSSIYYVDFPTGNILLKDAEKVSKNSMVKKAVPLALGDNYEGNRIVGTDSNFVGLYQLKLAAGKFWKEDFEVNIGAEVARSQKLKVGDKFYGAHGLSDNSDVHKTHAYVVAGILEEKVNVVDHLVITNMASIWKMHQEAEEHEDIEQAEISEEHDLHHENDGQESFENGEKEITALLIQYRSPKSVVLFPRMINTSTNMQAASPAMESARLFSLIGTGIETMQNFASLIIIIAAISVFINLYNSLKERKYDLAIMRTLGSSKLKLFGILVVEGLIITFTGCLLGLGFGHLFVEMIGYYQQSGQLRLSGYIFLNDELFLIVAGLGVGLIASLLPAIQAYKVDISKTLAQ